MEKKRKQIFFNTILWGFFLWLFGYILGFVFFPIAPKEAIGWFILPFGLGVTLWVLLKKIKRDTFSCYIGLGVIWTIIAVIFDYIFLVQLLNATDYYKFDVYCYYFLTLTLPMIVGWFKLHATKK